MAREQKWHPYYLGQPVYNALLASLFQWGVALHDLDLERIRKGEKDPKEMKRQLRQIVRKGRNQILKDYVVYPALAGRQWKTTLVANASANFARNLWSYMIIFCGHFPDGALHFTEEELEDETRAEWYLRQMLGSANFEGGRTLHILSGSLGYQIEHHLFPDLPSNRYPEISVKVRALCDKYDIPYTIGPLHRQYGQALRTILKLSLPNHLTSTDETSYDHKRRSDAERQPRRRELGASGSTTDGRCAHDVRRATARPAARGAGAVRLLVTPRARQAPGHPVRAQSGLRCLRRQPRPADRVPRLGARGGPQRLPLPAHA
jgi:linoleoyl-CoA desaturase